MYVRNKFYRKELREILRSVESASVQNIIGRIQRIRQLSERLVIIACDWNILLHPRKSRRMYQ